MALSQNRSGSWRGIIREHRRRIQEDLQDSPSLNPYLQEVFAECYTAAHAQAADETGLPLTTFPNQLGGRSWVVYILV